MTVIARTEPTMGITVFEVPGLGYWASEDAARAAIAKLESGACPMTHRIERGFAPIACHICGTVETVEA